MYAHRRGFAAQWRLACLPFAGARSTWHRPPQFHRCRQGRAAGSLRTAGDPRPAHRRMSSPTRVVLQAPICGTASKTAGTPCRARRHGNVAKSSRCGRHAAMLQACFPEVVHLIFATASVATCLSMSRQFAGLKPTTNSLFRYFVIRRAVPQSLGVRVLGIPVPRRRRMDCSRRAVPSRCVRVAELIVGRPRPFRCSSVRRGALRTCRAGAMVEVSALRFDLGVHDHQPVGWPRCSTKCRSLCVPSDTSRPRGWIPSVSRRCRASMLTVNSAMLLPSLGAISTKSRCLVTALVPSGKRSLP